MFHLTVVCGRMYRMQTTLVNGKKSTQITGKFGATTKRDWRKQNVQSKYAEYTGISLEMTNLREKEPAPNISLKIHLHFQREWKTVEDVEELSNVQHTEGVQIIRLEYNILIFGYLLLLLLLLFQYIQFICFVCFFSLFCVNVTWSYFVRCVLMFSVFSLCLCATNKNIHESK